MPTYGQYRYYRGVVLPRFNAYVGYAVLAECHYWLKELHIPPSLWEDGEPPSTAVLTVEQFSDFVDAVLMHAGEWGIYIPAPGERDEP